MGRALLVFLGLTVLKQAYSLIPDSVNSSHQASDDNSYHHRQKRLIWITNNGRIAFPPGTKMAITPTLSMPLIRHPPEGLESTFTLSFPFSINLDELGLTDKENPYGSVPSIFERAFKGRKAGAAVADLLANFMERKRFKRDVMDFPKQFFRGGERALLYVMAEDLLSNLGMNGKACLLRAICEVQGHPLSNFGLVGEMLRLFFTASKSPFSHLLKEYVEAENKGKMDGECWSYFKECPKSLFLPSENKYNKHSFHEEDESNQIIL